MQSNAGSGWSGKDRRRELRAEVSIVAEINVAGKTYLGQIRHLSNLGAHIELMDADPFPHEGNVRIVVGDPGQAIDAVIRRKASGEARLVTGLGVEFLEVDATVQEWLERLLGQSS